MILTLVSQKGGVGKSTLAVALAWELQSRGSRVLVVDSDPQGTVRVTGEVAAEHGAAAPSIVALGKDMYRPDQLPTLARSFDHVVIDTPGRVSEVARAALMVADVAILPVGQSAADGWGVADTVELVRQAQTIRPQLKAALVLTRKLPRTTLGKAARQVLEDCGLPVLETETTFRVAWQESLAAGQGVAQYAPRDGAAKELRALLNEIVAFAAPAKLPEVAHG